MTQHEIRLDLTVDSPNEMAELVEALSADLMGEHDDLTKVKYRICDVRHVGSKEYEDGIVGETYYEDTTKIGDERRNGLILNFDGHVIGKYIGEKLDGSTEKISFETAKFDRADLNPRCGYDGQTLEWHRTVVFGDGSGKTNGDLICCEFAKGK